MGATRARILRRHKPHELWPAGPLDFACGPKHPIDADLILTAPEISLYCLDHVNREAVFVEKPEVSAAAPSLPFLYQEQFVRGTHVLRLSFETLSRLANAASFDPACLILLHSVGRCGSTLVSRALGAATEVCSLSEPDVFTQLVSWRTGCHVSERELRELIDSSVRILCRPTAGKRSARRWAIKFRSQCLEIGDILLDQFPTARHLYLTRDPLSWLESVHRAYVDPARVEDDDYKHAIERMQARMLPIVRQHRIDGNPMPVWQAWLLNWIANTRRHRDLVDKGFSFLTVDFAELKAAPEKTIRRIYDYCGLSTHEWERVKRELLRDSQENSVLAAAAIDDPRRALPSRSRREARDLLASFGYGLPEV